MYKVCCLLLVGSVAASPTGPPEAVEARPYSYQYSVTDGLTGDVKQASEARHQDGVVTGAYSLLEPDGVTRTVEYTAHPLTGFQAVVRRNGEQVHSEEVVGVTSQSGAQNGAQYGAQNGAQSGAQNGAQYGAQNGAQNGAQYGAQSGAQNGAQYGAQNGAQYGAQNGAQYGTLNGAQTGAQPQTGVQPQYVQLLPTVVTASQINNNQVTGLQSQNGQSLSAQGYDGSQDYQQLEQSSQPNQGNNYQASQNNNYLTSQGNYQASQNGYQAQGVSQGYQANQGSYQASQGNSYQAQGQVSQGYQGNYQASHGNNYQDNNQASQSAQARSMNYQAQAYQASRYQGQGDLRRNYQANQALLGQSSHQASLAYQVSGLSSQAPQQFDNGERRSFEVDSGDAYHQLSSRAQYLGLPSGRYPVTPIVQPYYQPVLIH